MGKHRTHTHTHTRTNVESGMIVLDPVWLSRVFRSLMIHRDKYIKVSRM